VAPIDTEAAPELSTEQLVEATREPVRAALARVRLLMVGVAEMEAQRAAHSAMEVNYNPQRLATHIGFARTAAETAAVAHRALGENR
jgi:hypothetical protein